MDFQFYNSNFLDDDHLALKRTKNALHSTVGFSLKIGGWQERKKEREREGRKEREREGRKDRKRESEKKR